ncbi:Wall-associated receptor kinase 5 [Vitis vinifera]|uniref:Wall-associated receptor kinase 5 n=1 Tax=Vitis vinifera TaxID=29760 RepID=A0A438G3K2_VITVI|nr:Wall-associated receptor kinase 5 [Vitis vinifera]
MAMQVILDHPVTIIILLLFSSKETAASMAKPGCQETCGNVGIVYPFGIGRGCYHDKNFEVSCAYSSNPPRPSLVVLQVEVLKTSPDNVRICDWTVAACYFDYTSQAASAFTPMEPYSYSHAENKFIGIGCDIGAYIGELNRTSRSLTRYAGGVCQFATYLEVKPGLIHVVQAMAGSNSNPCSFAIIAEKNFSDFDRFDTTLSGENKTYFYPAILNWAIGNKSCQEARKRSDYACGSNSRCVDSDQGSGYKCRCSQGYRGNPYLQDGCIDINECMDPNNTLCKKGAVCINTYGGYYCACPPGYHSHDSQPEHGCVRDKVKLKAAILVTSGIGIAVVLLILLAVGFWLHRQLEERKKNKLKQKLFKRNGGLLLQQQITSSGKGSVEKTKLYTIEELEKATDNFNASRVLGRGGHGTVYKGMLLDGSIVAIKKSIIVDERQVVTTLSHHLHDRNCESKLSWEKRLRIADEIAGALAYLHTYASPAILHRDIKSSNILLDEHFRAVVSDFGLSRSITHEKTHLTTLVQGTFGYLDPGYFRSGQFTDKSDVYAFGVVLAELLTGEKVICSSRSEASLATHFRLAMKQNYLFEILDKVILDDGQKEEILAVARLAKICLKLGGKKRPTMKEIAADLDQLRRTMEQPSLQRTCQDNCSVSGRSYSYASTSAVTEEYVLEDQDFPKPYGMAT